MNVSGGLDEALNAIIEMSQKQDVPFVFALGRRALGRACAKLVPVSVVGVFSYEGCEVRNFFYTFGILTGSLQIQLTLYIILFMDSEDSLKVN